MADQDPSSRGLLWMFRHAPADGESGSASLDSAGSLYTLFKNTRNPFLKRAIAPGPQAKVRSGGELAQLVQFLGEGQPYLAAPANQADPYRRRQLRHAAPPAARNPQFQEPVRLQGEAQRLPPLVDDFFRFILDRLRADPQSFDSVVQDLAARLKNHGITLRIYSAYQALEDWDDLLETLHEIARFPSVETFDLFCSALFVYHDLVYGPGSR
jgi:hypothetical protein